MSAQLLDEAPVVTEAPAEELKCTARAHLGHQTALGWEPVECGIKAVALFHSTCGGPASVVFICQPLLDIYVVGMTSDAHCGACQRPLTEDWMVTPL